jgi:hypothetical protein
MTTPFSCTVCSCTDFIIRDKVITNVEFNDLCNLLVEETDDAASTLSTVEFSLKCESSNCEHEGIWHRMHIRSLEMINLIERYESVLLKDISMVRLE